MIQKRRVYLDWNATALPLAAALDATEHTSRCCWGNPSSVHAEGRQARAVLEVAREQVLGCLGGGIRSELTFTSGGTESNNLALRSLCARGGTLVTSRLEHPSVVRVAEDIARHGGDVHWIPVLPDGQVDVDAVARVLRSAAAPVVVALQAVNHETGVIQPVEAVAALCRDAGAALHVDAIQAVGKLSSTLWAGADSVSVAAHKLGGPKGIGAVASSCALLQPLLLGGAQEGRLRPGTTPVPLAAGFGVAADWARASAPLYASLRKLRDRLERALVELGGEVNGTAPRVPHVLNVSFGQLPADELVAALDVEGVAVSGGSACSSGTVERSPVIEAMLGPDRARGAVRASLGPSTTQEDIELAIAVWRRVVTRGRADG